jgi:ribosomal protein S18 acetylase RimI-like enzyme
MAVVQTAGRTGSNTAQSGIRPFDIGRDLRPVAELIADAFANELDDRGAAALREMRVMSRLGGLLGLLNMAGGELSDFFGGFVWVEDGKVVGNITVQRADKHGARWQIANVAVAREWRGRKFSRRLMERALSHIREQGGKWAVLQVYAENQVARTLYEHLGFETVGGMTDLRAPRIPQVLPPLVPMPDLHPFGSWQWQSLYDLANNQIGPQAQWWRPVRRSEFEQSIEQQGTEWLWRTVGRRQIFRRCIQYDQRFEAALVLTAQRWKGSHKLQLWVRPENYGRDEANLIQWVLHTLKYFPVWPIETTVSSDHVAALEVLERFGFAPLRTLLTMRLELGRESSTFLPVQP